MKSDRLLSSLMLLQAHGRLSTREIAERLEVSQRTAHRDMEALCLAGIPLIVHRGASGGWELQKGWRTKVPGLDDADLQALLMAQPSALGDRKLTAAATPEGPAPTTTTRCPLINTSHGRGHIGTNSVRSCRPR